MSECVRHYCPDHTEELFYTAVCGVVINPKDVSPGHVDFTDYPDSTLSYLTITCQQCLLAERRQVDAIKFHVLFEQNRYAWRKYLQGLASDE
jgi:hypothetical protein